MTFLNSVIILFALPALISSFCLSPQQSRISVLQSHKSPSPGEHDGNIKSIAQAYGQNALKYIPQVTTAVVLINQLILNPLKVNAAGAYVY